MKKQFINLIVLLFSISSFASVNWLSDLEQAKKVAIATNKLIFVDFTASWCGPCRMMERESWSNNEVATLMSSYVPVQIDLDQQRSLAQKYGVRGIPNLFILDSNGYVLYEDMSYKTKSQVLNLLKKYALNTSYMQQEYLAYFKNKNSITTYRLANKILDYTLLLDKSLKKDFLTLSKIYSKNLEKTLSKDAKSNVNLKFGADLLKIQQLLYAKKSKKAFKLIEKIDLSKLNNSLTARYYFLNYIYYKLVKDSEKERLWLTKIETTKYAKNYKSKAKLLFK